LTRNAFTAAEQKIIEDGAFRPEVDFITKDLQKWFDQVHNHGVWACAGVGIVGIATGNKEYVDMALYGIAKDGKRGFIAQMDNLFSPDGYYTEGPYYVRYAILPYYLFANALHHARPALKIFEHRDRILQKALHAGLQQTNENGRFFPLNDAIREKDYTTNEMVTAIGIAWNVYGPDDGLLYMAKQQKKVLLNKGGASIAAAVAARGNGVTKFPYKTVHYRDGAKGNEGGLSLLRAGNATLIYKYTAHGLSHGHFDKLHIGLYDQGNEILTDYGSVRFVNVEQKYGGRYLPENDTWSAQTIAHNTIVVDETSHFNGDERLGGQHPAELFYKAADSFAQVVSATADDAYNDVALHRTVYLVNLPNRQRFVLDVFRATSGGTHQYDLPFHFSGQPINTSFKYTPFTNQLQTLGAKNGYQFLWKEAEAAVKDTTVQFTFLNGQTYYTISSLIQDSARLFFARTGANDPSFNMRREPCFIIRKTGGPQTFVNVVEMHGRYDAVMEFSTNAYPKVQKIALLRNDQKYTVMSIAMGDKVLLVAQSNDNNSPGQKHSLAVDADTIQWQGPYYYKLINL
ncbi:MAG TPA: alginate lyase family protein, partial [Chitinophagaceae bacterium]|nr:alginate lyase family protein [Chitinophagaceae bacterium]